MNTISDYTIYCTPEQTKKALELGAPLEKMLVEEESYYQGHSYNREVEGYRKPTAEQMIGWLEEQEGVDFSLKKYEYYYHSYINEKYIGNFKTRKEATLAAIDAALEYLTNNKK